MKSVERTWDWWAYHYRVVHRSQIPGIVQWDDDLVEMIVDVLGLRPGDRILDLACGGGEHSRRLARRGLDVVGVDIAPSLVTHCQTMAAEEGLATPQFEVGDMRGLAYDEEFDAVVLISGSFGFFDDATNLNVLAGMTRALKIGGRILIDVSDPGQMMVRPPRRTWSQYGGGFGLRTVWWEPDTFTYVSEFAFIDDKGILNTAAEQERIRIYSLPEWQAMFAEVGLVMTHSLAETKLPLVPYDHDHYGNLVIVGYRAGKAR